MSFSHSSFTRRLSPAAAHLASQSASYHGVRKDHLFRTVLQRPQLGRRLLASLWTRIHSRSKQEHLEFLWYQNGNRTEHELAYLHSATTRFRIGRIARPNCRHGRFVPILCEPILGSFRHERYLPPLWRCYLNYSCHSLAQPYGRVGWSRFASCVAQYCISRSIWLKSCCPWSFVPPSL